MVETEAVRQALRQVKDPEVGSNIVDLGLVYTIDVNGGDVRIEMTLTSPGCPAGGQILAEADAVTREVEGVKNVSVELVWEPFWSPERIDPKVRAYLGF
jgi:metal-sulfur cluster biosynthetic enzyme